MERELRGWYHDHVAFLPRCVHLFGEDLSILIYSALIGREIEVQGGKECDRDDIAALIRTLSLTPLLQQKELVPKGSLTTANGPFSLTTWPTATLSLGEDGAFSFSK